jgi:proline dehydrogenase
MIALARSESVTRLFQHSRAGSFLARRYVAARDPEAAVAIAADLHSQQGLRSSLFYLGEYVTSPDLVSENVAQKLAVIRQLAKTDLDCHVSVDPTQIGHAIDPASARKNAFGLARAITAAAQSRSGTHCLMLDMEDSSLVTATIALHDELRRGGLSVALTLQAYLRRTEQDLVAQIESGGRIRLVKGAFAAPTTIAFTKQSYIKDNYRRLIELMFSVNARAAGFYPIVATHDERLHDFTISVARSNGWTAEEYEFEMLLGVRSNVSAALARRGYRVRLYVPFGRDWWPYAARRIGENPRNGLLLARSLIQ